MHKRRTTIAAVVGALAFVGTLGVVPAVQADDYDPASWAWSSPMRGTVELPGVSGYPNRIDVQHPFTQWDDDPSQFSHDDYYQPRGMQGPGTPEGSVTTSCLKPDVVLNSGIIPDANAPEIFPGAGATVWAQPGHLPNSRAPQVDYPLVSYNHQPRATESFDILSLPCAQVWGLTGEVYVGGADEVTGIKDKKEYLTEEEKAAGVLNGVAQYVQGSNNGIVTFWGFPTSEELAINSWASGQAHVIARTTSGAQVNLGIGLDFSPWEGSVSAADHTFTTPVGVPVAMSGDQLREGATWAGDIASLSATPFGELPANLGVGAPAAPFTFTPTSPGETTFRYQLRDSSEDYISDPATVTILATDVGPEPEPEPEPELPIVSG